MVSYLTKVRYPKGKFCILASGESKYARIAEECFSATSSIAVTIDKEKFLRLMREAGVPEDVASYYVCSASVVDETYAVDKEY